MTPSALTARKVLADAKRAGVMLSANGNRLAFDAPAGAMTPELRAALAACKAELLALLRGDYLNAAVLLLLSLLLSPLSDPDQWEALADLFDKRVAAHERDGMSRGEAERHAYIELAMTIERGEPLCK